MEHLKVYLLLVGNYDGRRVLGRPWLNGRVILKWVSKYNEASELDSWVLKLGYGRFCENNNEFSVS